MAHKLSVPNISSQQLSAYLAREAQRKAEQRSPHEPTENEVGKGGLHEQIMAECERRGWICLHGSTAHRAMRTEGEFDFVILAEFGLNLHIEGKAKNRKLSPKQQQLHALARKLGHHPKVVQSFPEFLEWINERQRAWLTSPNRASTGCR